MRTTITSRQNERRKSWARSRCFQVEMRNWNEQHEAQVVRSPESLSISLCASIYFTRSSLLFSCAKRRPFLSLQLLLPPSSFSRAPLAAAGLPLYTRAFVLLCELNNSNDHYDSFVVLEIRRHEFCLIRRTLNISSLLLTSDKRWDDRKSRKFVKFFCEMIMLLSYATQDSCAI